MKKAFTLAEVLITLSIIGVVASMSIPNLVQDVQDAEYKAKFKKEYAVLSSAYTRARLARGSSLKGIPIYHFPLLQPALPYLNTNNICYDWQSFHDGYYPGCPHCDPPIEKNNPGDYSGKCWTSTKYKLLNNKIVDLGWPDMAGTVLADSTYLIISHTAPECTITYSRTAPVTYNSPLVCGDMLIDINGDKGPNKVGKDLYGIWILKDRLVPFGSNDNAVNTCNINSSGFGCATEYLSE